MFEDSQEPGQLAQGEQGQEWNEPRSKMGEIIRGLGAARTLAALGKMENYRNQAMI